MLRWPLFLSLVLLLSASARAIERAGRYLQGLSVPSQYDPAY